MNTPFDYLILSPHPDDAVFSLGQHLINWTKSGKTIKIINVFNSYGTEDLASENAWNFLLKYGYKNVKELTRSRQTDQKNIITRMGIEVDSLNYVDASFRLFSTTPVYVTHQALMSGRISTYDSQLPQQIIDKISTISYHQIICPYGVGNHADHTILRKVGDILKKQKKPVKYYLESPYIWRDFNYVKYSVQILRASSYLNQVSAKNDLLKLYSYYHLLVRDHESFPEVIVD